MTESVGSSVAPAAPAVAAAAGTTGEGKSFLEALRIRYGAVDETQYDFAINQQTASAPVSAAAARRAITQKKWEVVGVEKTRQKQLRHQLLTCVVLNTVGLTVAERVDGEIRDEHLDRIVELDLANNKELPAGAIDTIVHSLSKLHELQLNDVPLPRGLVASRPWDRMTLLALNRTGITWKDVLTTIDCPSLRTMYLAGNGFTTLTTMTADDDSTATGHLKTFTALTELNISENALSSWPEIGATLSRHFPAITVLSVNDNNLPDIDRAEAAGFHFAPHLTTLGVMGNPRMTSFLRLHEMHTLFPNLVTLRVTYAFMLPGTAENVARSLTIAALPRISNLNHATVRAKERVDAELFYLQRALQTPDEEQRKAAYPNWVALREVHAEAVLSAQSTEVAGGAGFMLKLTIRCDEHGKVVERSVPSSLAVAKLKTLIAACIPQAPALKQILRFCHGGADGAVPVLVPLDQDLPTLSFFGVNSGSTISVTIAK